jgi:hypothetical protein
VRCLSCHYDLSNLIPGIGGEHRCPECGRAFDPNKPATFVARPDPATRHARRVWLFAFLAIAGGAVSLMFLRSPAPHGKDAPALVIVFLAWLAVVAIGTFVFLKLGPKTSPPS